MCDKANKMHMRKLHFDNRIRRTATTGRWLRDSSTNHNRNLSIRSNVVRFACSHRLEHSSFRTTIVVCRLPWRPFEIEENFASCLNSSKREAQVKLDLVVDYVQCGQLHLHLQHRGFVEDVKYVCPNVATNTHTHKMKLWNISNHLESLLIRPSFEILATQQNTTKKATTSEKWQMQLQNVKWKPFYTRSDFHPAK